MDYMPHTEQDIQEMLKTIGVASVEKLFPEIQAQNLFLKSPLQVPTSMTEQQVRVQVESMAAKNNLPNLSFLGAGAYQHFIPAVVRQLLLRGEFYTAYTPYQAEVSQGTLTTIFEFQSYISRLTGMDAANASLYEGATATVEAAMMAHYTNKRKKFLVASTLHPHYRATLKTYLKGFTLVEKEFNKVTGQIDLSTNGIKDDLKEVAAIIVQTPNFFGCLEQVSELAKLAHDSGALLIVVVNELASLSLLDTSSADIVCGEAQGLGNFISYGGPYVGFIACKQEHMRRLPGRIVGKTHDAAGNEGLMLTLQAREQHIRREKATSNICTNQALCALATTLFLSTVGKHGFKQLGEVNHSHAHYLVELLKKKGIAPLFNAPHFNEIVVKVPHAQKLHDSLLSQSILAGYILEKDYPALKDCLLLCATELHSKADLDLLAAKLGDVHASH